MTHAAIPERTERAPNGVSEQLRIACTPAERQAVIDMARREHRSTSAQARLLMQRGIDALNADAAERPR